MTETRNIIGTGSNVLPCPGLVTVSGVKSSHVENNVATGSNIERWHDIPATIDEGGEDVALWRQGVDTADGTTPALIRTFRSNGGVWQTDSIFAVTGEWSVRGDRRIELLERL